ncbi:hypothetical protein [Pelagibius sp.]|uniref:hypothetical protein n=1 Tax=Pelagibius sp. TaxID=1931238 RepID=UPI003BAF6B43
MESPGNRARRERARPSSKANQNPLDGIEDARLAAAGILAAIANMDAAEKHQLLDMVREIASIEGGGLSDSPLDALERLRRQRA